MTWAKGTGLHNSLPLRLEPQCQSKCPGSSDIAFWKSLTAIEDDAVLKQHILAIQARAYKVAPYPCIRILSFARVKISRLAFFEQVQQLPRDRPGAILLDIGCCFGSDAREIVYGGFPASNIVATDVIPELWDLGHELYMSTPETFPAHFIPGDAFNPLHLSAAPPSRVATDTCLPDLTTLKSLNPLRGHISIIHASSFLHLFGEEKQIYLARALAGLLSPEPGSMIFGVQAGSPIKGPLSRAFFAEGLELQLCHSPESWTALWDGEVFEQGTVKVDARLMQYPGIAEEFHLLVWSVTRI
ncbi:hypothetical protein BV22DRAFT_218164 [Leucogyrophana mollusca]|uniref:Uncharacterized protein n=1 Tax=Leucogyrophana mollusca TaxID=85980 RepID=A0ACB8BRG7_9AGAM|nr:hypothetical protein BV22DRAFT_218164 [Leucogyrophana mollusca]